MPPGVAEGSVLTVFRVAPEQAGQRLDVFLTRELRRTSRTRTQEIIKNSAYAEDGKRLSPNVRLRSEQRVLLWRPPWDEDLVPTEIPVVYEDDDFFAVSKPALLPVHPTARYYRNTLIKLLEQERKGQFVSLVHRIDRETSGVLLVSKSADIDRKLKKQLEERSGIDKRYLAITWGSPRGPLGETEFRYDRAMKLDPHNAYKVKMMLSDASDAQHAATRFCVLGERTHQGRTYALVQCDLETGRQHQIRLHLASLGCPIVGDKLYGPDERLFARSADGELTLGDLARLELPRHALHAHRLVVKHPRTAQTVTITAELPDDLSEFWLGL
jgi:23S rRNA pseudouridine1911/1915/1917 synthase